MMITVSPGWTSRAAAPTSRPVSLDVARAALAGDRVGLEAGAVVDVHDVNLLVLADVRGLEQLGVKRDRPDVVQIAVGHGGPVDLGLQHHTLHWVSRRSCSCGAAATRAGVRTV